MGAAEVLIVKMVPPAQQPIGMVIRAILQVKKILVEAAAELLILIVVQALKLTGQVAVDLVL